MSIPLGNTTPALIPFDNITHAFPLPYCANGTPYVVMPSVRVVTGITCVLSMAGAILIILSYILIKELRTKAREILVNLSLMDFMVAAANFTGVVANFDQYLVDKTHIKYPEPTYNVVEHVCVAQASFAMYGTHSSILWTIAIAVYIYLVIMYDKAPVVRRSTYAFYVICYGLPLISTLWFSLTGKLGYSRYGGSGWCSLVVKDEKTGVDQPFVAVFGNDMWIYLTIILVPVLFLAIHFYLRSEVVRKVHNVPLTRSITSTVQSVELKLLFIPIFFILLRIWSLIFIIIEIEAHVHLHCAAVLFFLHMGGIGDSGQGIANAILFCFLTPKVRRRFLQLLLCYCCWHKDTLRDSYASSTSHSAAAYGTIVPNHEMSDNSQTPSFINDQQDTKSLLLKT